MYTVTTCEMIRSWKIVFIIIWNVARELHSLKNMTRHSYSPYLVKNAVFHSSLSTTLMLLYPHLTSNFEKILAPDLVIVLITSPIRGRGYLFFIVYSFSLL